MFIDEVEITLKGGHGGPGKVSFYPPPMRGPDGGNGGRGGDVYIKAVSDLTALSQFSAKKFLEAKNGEAGWKNRSSGLNGENRVVLIPVGTTLTDKRTCEEITLESVDEEILVCKGGLGGRGNFEFKSSRNTTPEFAQPGLEGQERQFKVNLKLIADFGLVGLPNSGKSSLLNELTKANVKVGDYPFTTLEPNLGVFNGRVLADIPGLIEGASEGKGLGDRFLKHIEKVKTLLHCISSETDDLVKNYQTVRSELEKFNPELINKPEIVLLTKTDLLDKKQIEEKLKTLKKVNPNIYPVSIHDWDSVQSLEKAL